MRATLMPAATRVASTSPAASIAANASIIPMTVPRNPSSGATFETVASQTRPRSRPAISSRPTFSIALSTRSVPSSRRSRPATRMRPAGVLESRATAMASVILRLPMRSSTSRSTLLVRMPLDVRSMSFQTMTIRPTTAHSASGHMSSPPSLKNWTNHSVKV